MPKAMLPDNGMIHLSSQRSVEETLERLEEVVRKRGLTVFARIDHSGAATAAGLAMRPAQVLIFGSPKSGTPLMVAAPTLAIDLPLKALVWQDAEGTVWLSYNAPEYLAKRHNVPATLLANISGARAIFEEAASGGGVRS